MLHYKGKANLKTKRAKPWHLAAVFCISFYFKIYKLFYLKGRQGDLNFASQARNFRVDTKPPSPYLPLYPSSACSYEAKLEYPPHRTFKVACNRADALHAVKTPVNFNKGLKINGINLQQNLLLNLSQTISSKTSNLS